MKLIVAVAIAVSVLGCTKYSAFVHSPFANGGSAYDEDAKAHPYGAFGTDCGSYQCPEYEACGGKPSDGNPWGYGETDGCWPIADRSNWSGGHDAVPYCGMLGCGLR